MAYQKSKHVEAAQKFLHQGKVPQAVNEYLIILKHEPKDQITLMTVGDLFVRQGETFQALEYFERLAQIYLADGFLTKAIAIYKKITKLAPEEMRPVERLADLYVQQGVMSEARPIYLQMADMHQRANRPAQAVGLLRKLLDAEPDNPRVQSRLADLLVATSQPADAAAVLRTAAQQLLRRGDHAEALKFIDRTLKIDAQDAAAQALRARVLVGSGQQAEAVGMLESLPDVDAGGETSSLLVDLYLDAGETPRATELAERIFVRDAKRHAIVQHVAAALLDKGETERALVLLRRIQIAVLEGGDHERFSDLLSRAAEALPGQIEPLEVLVEVYKHTSDSFRLPDALFNLAEAYETAGRLDAALQAYAQFLDRDPENDAVRRKQERLQARVGLAGSPVAAPEPVVALQPDGAAEQTEAPAPPAPEDRLDQETQMFVSQAITDVDLYSSYGLTQKAVELLEIVLQRAPDYPPALERLLDTSLGMSDDARAVDLASRLERIYTEAGNKTAADRFADLRRRFERASPAPVSQGAAPVPTPSPSALQPPAPAESFAPPVPVEVNPLPAETSAPVDRSPVPVEFQIPVVEAQSEEESVPLGTPGVTGSPAADSVVHEVDLSEEWAALTNAPPETPAPAGAEFDPVESYDDLLNGIQSGDSAAIPEVLAEPAPEPVFASLTEEPEAPAETIPELVEQAAPGPVHEEVLADYAMALDGATAPSGKTTGNGNDMDGFMRSISAELDAILPLPSMPLQPPAPAPLAPPQRTPVAAAPKPPENRGPLGDLFDEFRADMGEGGDATEDPETHYNLGIAYREMGLMEEAISEFQKVAAAHQQGQPFRYAMQCYTLLALAFADKGQPSIAVSWYERALQVPGLDPETVLALRYDLGVSQEMAGDMEAAHKSFSQVYGTNIDYRDVAERLASLGRAR